MIHRRHGNPSDTTKVLEMIEEFHGYCDQFEGWLKGAEETMIEYGSVQADLPRLEEQEPILEVWECGCGGEYGCD